jgi:hypothetical protein
MAAVLAVEAAGCNHWQGYQQKCQWTSLIPAVEGRAITYGRVAAWSTTTSALRSGLRFVACIP